MLVELRYQPPGDNDDPNPKEVRYRRELSLDDLEILLQEFSDMGDEA
jgi:hypothetical protein